MRRIFTLSCAFFLLGTSLFSCSQKAVEEETGETKNNTEITAAADSEIINTKTQDSMVFELLKLPYATDALAPAISKRTVELHHGKHLQAYVDNLNKLLPGSGLEGKELIEIVKSSDGGIFNNAGQILNHNLYFTQFSPNGGENPKGELGAAIDATWGSFDAFKAEFKTKATTLFGSGWAWLACDKDGKLVITQDKNGSNPVVDNLIPLMGIDVWEHAYYLDYENKRADHIDAVWSIIDWNVVNERYIAR